MFKIKYGVIKYQKSRQKVPPATNLQPTFGAAKSFLKSKKWLKNYEIDPSTHRASFDTKIDLRSDRPAFFSKILVTL